MDVVGVTFNNESKVYYFCNKNLQLKKNLTVIVQTEKGLQFAKVVSFIKDDKIDYNIDYKEVIRISTKKDYLQYLNNIKDGEKALERCRELVQSAGLNMSVIDAKYNFERTQLIFRFVADERIDFRKLAKDLGSIFKTRIELRQIGIRDKAREIGGIGICGRLLCCNTFLNEFDSVSINMAKNQSLSLNPTKINGVCGRLLCCLNYENDNYEEYRRGLPDIGQIVQTKDGEGRVIYINLFKRSYLVSLENGTLVEEKVD